MHAHPLAALMRRRHESLAWDGPGQVLDSLGLSADAVAELHHQAGQYAAAPADDDEIMDWRDAPTTDIDDVPPAEPPTSATASETEALGKQLQACVRERLREAQLPEPLAWALLRLGNLLSRCSALSDLLDMELNAGLTGGQGCFGRLAHTGDEAMQCIAELAQARVHACCSRARELCTVSSFSVLQFFSCCGVKRRESNGPREEEPQNRRGSSVWTPTRNSARRQAEGIHAALVAVNEVEKRWIKGIMRALRGLPHRESKMRRAPALPHCSPVRLAGGLSERRPLLARGVCGFVMSSEELAPRQPARHHAAQIC